MYRFRGPVIHLFDFLMGRGDLITVIISFFSIAVIIFVLAPIHECAHGAMAKFLGDDTAEREGRLTLNPLAHIDPMGLLLKLLCSFGWAKPVPVNVTRCRKVSQRTALALIAFAGPLVNFLFAYILVIIEKIVFLVGVSGTADMVTLSYVVLAIGYTAEISMVLAVFNLLPFPPLDGSRILYSFIPNKGAQFMDRHGQIIHWVFVGLLLLGFLDIPLSFLSNGAMWLLDKASFFIPAPLF